MSLIAEAQALQYEMHSADEVAELRAMVTGSKGQALVYLCACNFPFWPDGR